MDTLLATAESAPRSRGCMGRTADAVASTATLTRRLPVLSSTHPVSAPSIACIQHSAPPRGRAHVTAWVLDVLQILSMSPFLSENGVQVPTFKAIMKTSDHTREVLESV